MKTSTTFNRPLPDRHRATLIRRIRLLIRLLVRRLHRVEFVETDARGNPKVNPIRWFV